MKLIDLTMPLNAETPVYPGDPSVILKTVAAIGSDGYHDTVLTLDTHNGTHIDAPAHMLDGGKTLDEFSVSDLVGRGALVEAASELTANAFQDVRQGDLVLLHTTYSDNFRATDYYDRVPSFADGAVEELIRRRPKLVAVDAGSIDHLPFELHKALLGANILIAENLVGLSALTGKEFDVYALPLKLDVDGSPARIIARVA